MAKQDWHFVVVVVLCLCGAWGASSGHHTCTASPLLTEPVPLLLPPPRPPIIPTPQSPSELLKGRTHMNKNPNLKVRVIQRCLMVLLITLQLTFLSKEEHEMNVFMQT